VVLGGLILALFADMVADMVVDTGRFVFDSLLSVAPIVLFAVLLASAIRASGADRVIARRFEGRILTMIIAASALGAITPVCGIGVLPIIAGLLAGGVPLAPIMAFWLSSPITDPAMLVVTAGLLGLPFAIGKTAIAFGIGLLGGVATLIVIARGGFAQPAKARPAKTQPASVGAAASPLCETPCGTVELEWAFWRDPERRRQFTGDARATAWLMLKWLSLAFALESLLRAHLPAELIAGAVGADTAWAIPLAVGIGAPLYLDGYAALPLVRGLIELGMAPGAAMAFLVSGGITSLYASVAVWALVRGPVFAWYLGLAVAGSALGGWGYGLAVG
jgi:uncharacterized membrane protein YraQ (UPF0718 family)